MAEIGGRKYGDVPNIGTDYVAADPLIADFPESWIPFERLLQNAQGEDAVIPETPNANMEIDFITGDEVPLVITVVSYSSNTVTVSAAADINGLYAGVELYDKTNDHYWIVDAVDDTGPTFDIYSVTGSGDPAADTELITVGVSQGEGGRIGVPSYEWTANQNYVQSFAVEINASDFYELVNMRVDDWGYQQQQLLKRFTRKQEMALMLGTKTSGTISGTSNEPSYGKHYFTGGIRYWISQAGSANAEDFALTNFTGAAGMTKWKDFEQLAFTKHESPIVYGVVGLEFYRALHDLYESVTNVEFRAEEGKEYTLFVIPTFIGKTLKVLIHAGFTGPFKYYGQFFNPEQLQIGEAKPYMIRQIDYGRDDKKGYKLKRIMGLKPRTYSNLYSFELTE